MLRTAGHQKHRQNLHECFERNTWGYLQYFLGPAIGLRGPVVTIFEDFAPGSENLEGAFERDDLQSRITQNFVLSIVHEYVDGGVGIALALNTRPVDFREVLSQFGGRSFQAAIKDAIELHYSDAIWSRFVVRS